MPAFKSVIPSAVKEQLQSGPSPSSINPLFNDKDGEGDGDAVRGGPQFGSTVRVGLMTKKGQKQHVCRNRGCMFILSTFS